LWRSGKNTDFFCRPITRGARDPAVRTATARLRFVSAVAETVVRLSFMPRRGARRMHSRAVGSGTREALARGIAMNTRRGFLRDTLALAGALAAADGQLASPAAEAPNEERTEPSNGGRNVGNHLNIGAIVYPRMDQIDFTGPFEVLSRLP